MLLVLLFFGSCVFVASVVVFGSCGFALVFVLLLFLVFGLTHPILINTSLLIGCVCVGFSGGIIAKHPGSINWGRFIRGQHCRGGSSFLEGPLFGWCSREPTRKTASCGVPAAAFAFQKRAVP